MSNNLNVAVFLDLPLQPSKNIWHFQILYDSHAYILVMNFFCGIGDQQKVLSFIPARTIVRDSPMQIFDWLQARFEPMWKLSPGFIEWSFVVVITTTPQHHNGGSIWINLWNMLSSPNLLNLQYYNHSLHS